VATWVRTLQTVPQATSGDVAGGFALVAASAPADFDPDLITSVTYSYDVVITGLADDSWTHHQGARISLSANLYDSSSVSAGDETLTANGTYPRSYTDNSPNSAGDLLSDWESDARVSGQNVTAFLTHNANMKADATTASLQNFTITITYTPMQPPVASFTADKTTVYAGQQVQFTDTSTNNPTSPWSWAITPGSNGNEWTANPLYDLSSQNPLVLFNTIGVYSVTLTASNGAGSDVSDPTTITVVEPPPQGVPFIVSVAHESLTATYVINPP
jgi:PKD repeat protein